MVVRGGHGVLRHLFGTSERALSAFVFRKALHQRIEPNLQKTEAKSCMCFVLYKKPASNFNDVFLYVEMIRMDDPHRTLFNTPSHHLFEMVRVVVLIDSTVSLFVRQEETKPKPKPNNTIGAALG